MAVFYPQGRAPMPLTKDDVMIAIKRELITASSSLEDATCRSDHDPDFQARLKGLWRGIRNEIDYLDTIAPRIERPAAGRAQ
jgi:hypothetical protein